MVTVKIDEEELLGMLTERVCYWTKEDNEIKLFEQMYNSYIENDCFNEMELNINVIVDNDWVNNCDIITDTDERFEELARRYEEGERDVSCDDLDCSFIEAYLPQEKLILVRY